MSNFALPTAHPSRPDTLDRTVLALTLCVWVGHFLLLSTLLYFVPGQACDLATLAARAAISATGIALCLAMYAWLRNRDRTRPWALLLKAAALSVVSSALLVIAGKLAFLLLTPYYRLNPDDFLNPYLTGWLYIGYLWMLLTWSALFVGAVAIREMHRRQAQLVAVRSATREAQLLALHLQINPHFLFNTLNTLAGFIALDRRGESERIVLNLSRFLRHTLTRTPSQRIPLSEEIDMLRMYLEIETARFRDRLTVHYDIPTGCERALVPSLVLLPLAENSVKYALGNAEDGIDIRIGARRDDRTLLLWLEDDGAPPESAGKGLGIGLSNIRQQLTALFGDAAQFHAGPTEHGWRNLIRIPWQEAP